MCRPRGRPSALHNWAIVTRPPRDWAQTAGAIATAYPDGVAALVISPFPTPDLTRHGLGLVGHPPLMFRPTTTPRRPRKPRSTSGRRRRTSSCGTPRGCSSRATRCPTWPTSRPATSTPGGRAGPTKVFVGYDGETPVATSAAHSAAGVTVVENVAVLASARGQRAGAALTWAATTAWPGQSAVLIASDDGQPVYERLGYLRLERWTCWLRP